MPVPSLRLTQVIGSIDATMSYSVWLAVIDHCLLSGPITYKAFQHSSALAQTFTWLPQADRRYSSSKGRPAIMNAVHMLKRRESHLGCMGGFSAAQCCHLGSFQYLPSRATRMVDRMQSRVYIGNFSAQGNVFVGELKQQGLGAFLCHVLTSPAIGFHLHGVQFCFFRRRIPCSSGFLTQHYFALIRWGQIIQLALCMRLGVCHCNLSNRSCALMLLGILDMGHAHPLQDAESQTHSLPKTNGLLPEKQKMSSHRDLGSCRAQQPGLPAQGVAEPGTTTPCATGTCTPPYLQPLYAFTTK